MEELWKQAKEHLRHATKPIFYERFIKNIQVISSTEDGLVLQAENDQIRSHIESRYLDDINRILTKLNNGSEMSVRFFHPGERLKQAKPAQLNVGRTNTVYEAPQTTGKVKADVFHKNTINPKYTFDDFVCGTSNKLAFEASKAVVDSPGTNYNPLYIFGRPGLGKTHLLHSVANELKKTRPWLSIVYMQLDTFQSMWIRAIRENHTESFKAKMRTIDVLLIDDVHALNKNATNTGEELFNTFNYLHSLNKQILLTSDRTPSELKIEERLRSRFGWGLITELTLPHYETRRVIIETKAKKLGIEIDEDVLHYLAENVDSNIRFLEAAVNKLQAQSKLLHKPIELNMAIRVTRAIAQTSGRPSEMQFETILKAVAKITGVNEFELLSKKRDKNIALARHLGMYLACNLTKLSKKQIANKFGKSDHTTVLHAQKKMMRLVEEDITVKTLHDEILLEIQSTQS